MIKILFFFISEQFRIDVLKLHYKFLLDADSDSRDIKSNCIAENKNVTTDVLSKARNIKFDFQKCQMNRRSVEVFRYVHYNFIPFISRFHAFYSRRHRQNTTKTFLQKAIIFVI